MQQVINLVSSRKGIDPAILGIDRHQSFDKFTEHFPALGSLRTLDPFRFKDTPQARSGAETIWIFRIHSGRKERIRWHPYVGQEAGSLFVNMGTTDNREVSDLRQTKGA